MTKEVVIGLTTVLLVATPVFAAPGNGNGNSDSGKSNHGQEKKAEVLGEQVIPHEVLVTESPTPTLTITVSPTVTQSPLKLNKGQLKKVLGETDKDDTCDPNAEWKNHGEYVSCVAHKHPGGEVVSAAARSDVGKKHHHPSVTPSVSPTSTPSATPTVTPTPPVSSAELVLGISTDPVDTFFKAIGRFFMNLPFFHNHGHNK